MTPEQLQFTCASTPPIAPVETGGAARPYWSVVIPSFRPDFLERALKSVLAQDRGPERMQIEVMDDASPGERVREIVNHIGQGRVDVFRQPVNLGQFRNINAGIARARGRWIHVLHDDDWIGDGFYARLEEDLGDGDDYGAAMTAITIANVEGAPASAWSLLRPTSGPLPDAVGHFATSLRSQPPAIVVRRDVYETLGGFMSRWHSPGDWEMWQRIAAHYAWLYEPRAMAFYRAHGVSNSGTSKQTGLNVREAVEVIDFAQHYLPADRASELRLKARQAWARVALGTARRLLVRKDYEAASAQIVEALTIAPTRSSLKILLQQVASPQGEKRDPSF